MPPLRWLLTIAMVGGTVLLLINPPSETRDIRHDGQMGPWRYIGNSSIFNEGVRSSETRPERFRLILQIAAFNIALGGLLFWAFKKPRQVKIVLAICGGIVILAYLVSEIDRAAAETRKEQNKLSADAAAIAARPSPSAIPSPPPKSRPSHGQITIAPGYTGTARLTITPSQTFDYVIQFVDIFSSKCTCLIYLHSGESNVDVLVPIGNFRIKFAAGNKWLNEKFFGENGQYNELITTLEISDNRHRSVDLNKVGIGSFQVTKITLEQFTE